MTDNEDSGFIDPDFMPKAMNSVDSGESFKEVNLKIFLFFNPGGHADAVKKVLKNKLKINIIVNSNILCKELIQYALNEYNSALESEESQYYLEDSSDSIDKCYELCYPDDDETGEPDEDLPTFAMDQNVSTIGEKSFTLLVANPKLAIKNQDCDLHPNIQDPEGEADATKTTANEKSSGTFKRINSLGYLVTIKEDESSTNKTKSDEIIYHKSTQTCCKCTIF
ncbi:unnamed protein product [Moneuplotes crassus]|uniref:CRIM domain-containing protein n=1 Tax=Euplotes crassus TaxID=5936 RepID=A0AAD1UBW5_EUPCR|nr:unnamed protein product [Moneuplotes crassus]